jgi:hypothetical protein
LEQSKEREQMIAQGESLGSFFSSIIHVLVPTTNLIPVPDQYKADLTGMDTPGNASYVPSPADTMSCADVNTYKLACIDLIAQWSAKAQKANSKGLSNIAQIQSKLQAKLDGYMTLAEACQVKAAGGSGGSGNGSGDKPAGSSKLGLVIVAGGLGLALWASKKKSRITK